MVDSYSGVILSATSADRVDHEVEARVMSAGETFRGFAAWGRRLGAPQPEEGNGPVLSSRELRQRHLQRARLRGIPKWSENPERCDGCGRELLIGERGLILQLGGELAIACPLCTDRLKADGFLHAACDERDETEGRLRRAG
jgi:hypothetical protein